MDMLITIITIIIIIIIFIIMLHAFLISWWVCLEESMKT